MGQRSERRFTVTEHPQVPWLSVVLGYGPMFPLVAGAAGSWLTSGAFRHLLATLTVLWASSILAFLSGVRRGLSFRTEGGPTVAQIVTMFCLFVLALLAFSAERFGLSAIALALLLMGYLALLVADPIAARRGEAPEFFARLRPPQLTIAVLSLAALLAGVYLRR